MIVDDIQANGFDVEEQGRKVAVMLAARKSECLNDYEYASPQKD